MSESLPPAATDSRFLPWRILFMGTPEFAVPCLEALLQGPDRVVAVVAQPDKPSGRGQRLHSPPTIALARAHGIPTLQASKVRVPAFAEALRSFDADLAVVVAYGRILTPEVLSIPRFGCINVHASLLPRHRGAAPIQWSILRGEQVTGITTMRMDAGLDTGDMLLREEVPIPPGADAGQLHDLLAPVGAALMMRTIRALKAGKLIATPQDHTQATFAPPLKKEDGWIDWQKPATQVDWQVRGLTPWPGAFTLLAGKRLTVLEGQALPDAEIPASALPGTLLSTSDGTLVVSTGRGSYRIQRIKSENARAMDVPAYLCGHPVAVGSRLISTLEHS